MSLDLYTPTIDLGYNIAYNKELKVLFCYNKECLTSINTSSSSNSTITIVKKHFKKHSISLKDKNIKELYIKLENLEVASIKDLSSIENNKYYFKELKEAKKGYLCLVSKCNTIYSRKDKISKHLLEHYNKKEIKDTKDKSKYYNSSILIQSLFNKKDLLNYFIVKDNKVKENSLVNSSTIVLNNSISNNNINLVKDYKLEVEEYNNSTLLDFNKLEDREIPSNISKTKFYLYLNNKNINSLLKLVVLPSYNSSNIENNKEEYIEYKLYTIVESILYSIEPLVEKLNRRLRQQLQTEVLATNKEKNLKDFKLLSSKDVKRKYYKYISLFIIYLYRVYKEKRKDKSTIIKQPIIEDKVEENLSSIIEYIIDYIKETKSIKKDNLLDILDNKLLLSIKPRLLYIISCLLEQQLSQDTLEEYPSFNSPLLTYLAIKSINLASKTTKEAINIEQDCSYLIYTLRLFSIAIVDLQYNYLKVNNPIIKLEEIFLDFYSRNLTFNSSNSFEEITQIRAYTRAIASNNLTRPRIRDISSNIIIVDNTIEVNISNLKKLFSSIEDSLEEFLFSKILFLNPSDLVLDFNKLEDNISNLSSNYSFLVDKNNIKKYNIEDYSYFLIRRLEDTTSIFSKYFINSIEDNNTIDFNISNIKKFFANRKEFIKLLGLAFYLLGACPIRGTEVEILKYSNSIELGPRNLYIDNITKLIKVETSYSKSNSITNKDNNIVRFLSSKFSYLLKVYIILGIPFYNYLNYKVFNIRKPSPYILESNNRLLTSKEISNLLSIKSLEVLGIKLTIASYRQAIKYIIINRLNIDLDNILEEEKEDNNIEDVLFNHSTKVALSNYARSTNILANKTASLEQKSIDITRKIFTFLKINNRKINTNLKVFNPLARSLEKSFISTTISTTKSIEELIEDINIISSSSSNNNNNIDIYKEIDFNNYSNIKEDFNLISSTQEVLDKVYNKDSNIEKNNKSSFSINSSNSSNSSTTTLKKPIRKNYTILSSSSSSSSIDNSNLTTKEIEKPTTSIAKNIVNKKPKVIVNNSNLNKDLYIDYSSKDIDKNSSSIESSTSTSSTTSSSNSIKSYFKRFSNKKSIAIVRSKQKDIKPKEKIYSYNSLISISSSTSSTKSNKIKLIKDTSTIPLQVPIVSKPSINLKEKNSIEKKKQNIEKKSSNISSILTKIKEYNNREAKITKSKKKSFINNTNKNFIYKDNRLLLKNKNNSNNIESKNTSNLSLDNNTTTSLNNNSIRSNKSSNISIDKNSIKSNTSSNISIKDTSIKSNNNSNISLESNSSNNKSIRNSNNNSIRDIRLFFTKDNNRNTTLESSNSKKSSISSSRSNSIISLKNNNNTNKRVEYNSSKSISLLSSSNSNSSLKSNNSNIIESNNSNIIESSNNNIVESNNSNIIEEIDINLFNTRSSVLDRDLSYLANIDNKESYSNLALSSIDLTINSSKELVDPTTILPNSSFSKKIEEIINKDFNNSSNTSYLTSKSPSKRKPSIDLTKNSNSKLLKFNYLNSIIEKNLKKKILLV